MTQASNIPAAEDPLGALRRSMSHSAEIAVAPIHDFRALLVHELERAEDAEIQVDAALRRLSVATDNLKLRRLLQLRIHEGERVSSDIRAALEQYSSSHRHVHNRGASVLISQSERLLKLARTAETADLIILTGAQKLQFYCLSCWKSLHLLAKLLQDKELAVHLKGAVEEGLRWDRQLTELALSAEGKAPSGAASAR